MFTIKVFVSAIMLIFAALTGPGDNTEPPDLKLRASEENNKSNSFVMFSCSDFMYNYV